jgi:plasmid stabilization system protein ParE
MKRYRVIVTPEAQEDIERLQEFWIQAAGPDVAARAIDTIVKALDFLITFPHSCRNAKAQVSDKPCRELIIPFGSSGYLALFEIQEDTKRVAVLAMKHQRESDYH